MAVREKLLPSPAKHTQVVAVEVHLVTGESQLELAARVAVHPADYGRRLPVRPAPLL
jgi:hypothetical protein